MKHKAKLCAHVGMKQWGVNCWETCDKVVNWISVRSLLNIASKNELTIRSIEFVLPFPQSGLDADVFVGLPL